MVQDTNTYPYKPEDNRNPGLKENEKLQPEDNNMTYTAVGSAKYGQLIAK